MREFWVRFALMFFGIPLVLALIAGAAWALHLGFGIWLKDDMAWYASGGLLLWGFIVGMAGLDGGRGRL